MTVVGVGTEIVECLRIAQLIERHGELFLQRAFTVQEIAFCSSRAAATQHYAGHWAAKEAVLKCLGARLTSGMSYRDIEVRQRDGQPRIALGGAAREQCERLNINDLKISIAHCRTHATAFAVASGHG